MAKKKNGKLLSSKELNTIRGKCLVEKQTKEEMLSVFAHIDLLEAKLDETESDDTFGTEGWRHYFNHPDAD